MLYLIPNAFGVAAVLLMFAVYTQKNPHRMLGIKIAVDVCWILYFFFYSVLGLAPLWAGCLLSVISVGREYIFFQSDKKWAQSSWWIVFFIAISWISVLASWQGSICLLSAISTTCNILSMSSPTVKRARFWGVPTYILWAIYSWVCGGYIAAFSGLVAIASIVVGTAKDFFRRNTCPCHAKH